MLGPLSPKPFPLSALDNRPIQSQSCSTLLSLPAELRNRIFRYTLTTKDPVVNPSHNKNKSRHCNTTSIDTALLLTCRQTYAEADLRALFSFTRFRFTSPEIARDFFGRLPGPHRKLITDVELDMCELSNMNIMAIGRDWAQYMFWSDSKWAEAFGSLRHDAPNLKTLRLNFESWMTIPMKRHDLWEKLRRMIEFVRGLDALVVSGAGKGAWMEKQDPWSCVHYVGSDNAGEDDLVTRMSAAVGGGSGDRDKLIVWDRSAGKIHLQVVTKSHISAFRNVLPPVCEEMDFSKPLSPSGCCSIATYEQRADATAR